MPTHPVFCSAGHQTPDTAACQTSTPSAQLYPSPIIFYVSMCGEGSTHRRWSEDNHRELVLSFHYVSPIDQTPVSKLGSKHPLPADLFPPPILSFHRALVPVGWVTFSRYESQDKKCIQTIVSLIPKITAVTPTQYLTGMAFDINTSVTWEKQPQLSLAFLLKSIGSFF